MIWASLIVVFPLCNRLLSKPRIWFSRQEETCEQPEFFTGVNENLEQIFDEHRGETMVVQAVYYNSQAHQIGYYLVIMLHAFLETFSTKMKNN